MAIRDWSLGKTVRFYVAVLNHWWDSNGVRQPDDALMRALARVIVWLDPD